ncbi:MAG: hypothetical protein WCT31_00020 [Candidatus Micrarchaeia archaeon]
MGIMEQISGFMNVLNDAIGLPIVVSHTISEGVSDGISEGLNKNKKWVAHGAVKAVLFFIGLFFFCWGVIQIGDSAFPQHRGVTAIAVGLVLGVAILLVSNRE